MVFACHEGTIGYDRLLLKDRHVLVVHNFTETGNSHEHKCNRHFRKLLARLRDTHCGTLMLSLGLLLVVKVPTATNATNETRQHGIAWNQTSLGLTSKHFQPKPDLSRNNTPRWTSANQPQNSQSIRKALQKKNAKPAPLERFPHETQWCDAL